MSQDNKTSKKNSSVYLSIFVGVLVVIGAVVGLIYEGHQPSKLQAAKSTTQTISTQTASSSNPSQTLTELALQKLSNEIISGKVSASDADKLTVNAYQSYYSISEVPPQSSNYGNWMKIHQDLLNADKYAKSKEFNQLQATWQAIRGSLDSIQGP